MTIRAISDRILAIEGDFGDQTSEGGIFIKSTIGKSEGITPRWFKVLSVGPDIHFLNEGEWVLVAHNRWTTSVDIDGQNVWRLDPEGCIMSSDEKPDMLNIAVDSNVAFAPKKTMIDYRR